MPTGKSYLVLDPHKVSELLRGQNGPVVRELITAGELVRQEARRRVGVSEPDPVPRRNPRRPGTLRDSIVARLTFSGNDATVIVGSEEPYAAYHHDGTRPHTIAPRTAPRLVFYSKRRGRVVYMPKGKSVRHPGSKGNPFLIQALEKLRGRY